MSFNGSNPPAVPDQAGLQLLVAARGVRDLREQREQSQDPLELQRQETIRGRQESVNGLQGLG